MRNSSTDNEPALISYLRTCDTSPDNELAATIIGNSVAGLKIRPRILSYNEDGTKVYGLTGKQVKILLKNYDAHNFLLETRLDSSS
jgi:hypothetical protein